MITKRLLTLAGTLVAVASLTACESDLAGSGGARVRLLLTDAPGDFTSAQVEIREIYLQGSSAESTNGRLVLYSAGGTFDLLQLQNGVTAELSQIRVPAGSYSDLRIVVGDATVTTEDGRTFSTTDGTLQCPSCGTSGLKIKLPNGALQLENGDQSIIVDFDVNQSFGREAGRSGRWVMHPVVWATLAEASSSITGTVALAEAVTLPACGGGTPTLADFKPTATAGDVTTTGTTDASGNLRFNYLPAATYTFGVQVTEFSNGDRLTFTAVPSVESLVLASGTTGTVNYVINQATCQVAT